MTLLDNYKPREKKEFTYKCLGCMIMKKNSEKYRELAVKLDKYETCQSEIITLMDKMKNHGDNLFALLDEDSIVCQEVDKLISEEEFYENNKIYDEYQERINEKTKKFHEIERREINEKRRIVELRIKIIDKESEFVLLYNETIEAGKMIKIHQEKYDSLKMNHRC